MSDIYSIRHQVAGEEILKVCNLYGEKFKDISFTLHKGEILGFFGLVGAGRSEVMRAVFGVEKVYSRECMEKYFSGQGMDSSEEFSFFSRSFGKIIGQFIDGSQRKRRRKFKIGRAHV